jgi:hypothetical protein
MSEMHLQPLKACFKGAPGGAGIRAMDVLNFVYR